MDHNLDDAIDYINKMDVKPIEWDYTCSCCGNGFDHGIRCSDERFCNECVSEFLHHRYYEDHGWSVKEANVFIETNTIHI